MSQTTMTCLDPEDRLLALLEHVAEETRAILSIAAARRRLPEHFREIFRGERAARLGRHLCRLVLSPRSEAQRAGDAALRILAEARGYQLEPLPSAIATLVESTARLGKETLDLQTELARSLEGDGRYDAEELDRIDRETADIVRAVAQIQASSAAARRRL